MTWVLKLFSLIISFVTIYSNYGVFSRSARLDIRNGEDAKDGEFPYMAEIRTGDGCFVCGGSIIASNWILTAGHCLFEEFNPANYTIVYGTKWLYDCLDPDDDPETVIKAKTSYRHPAFSTNMINGVPSFDVALIELEEDIPFSNLAQPINLTDETSDVPIGELGNLTGWGASVSGSYPIENLQKIRLPALPNANCSAQIDGLIDEVAFNSTLSFCTDDQDNGQCNGDSGSPFVINGIQYGIVSWSIKPCGLYPGVFTRVALPEHREWIRNVTGV